MTPSDLVFLIGGVALFLAVVLPNLLKRFPISASMVLVAVGALIGLLPLDDRALSPIDHHAFVEHLTELCVLVALMGVGLALDRPLSLRAFGSFTSWSAPLRLLVLGMPLTIAGTALVGWWVLGVAPATALLLGAALSPTDPVLASDVQVGGPTTLDPEELAAARSGSSEQDHTHPAHTDPAHIDEEHEVRFSLTAEAGMNDGLAFPFVYLALGWMSAGSLGAWTLRWLAWTVVGKIVVGVAIGVAIGWLLGRLAFRAPTAALRAAEQGEPLLAVACLLLAYGAAEVAQGYGFLAVFAAAMTLRSVERHDAYHSSMHEVIERLERLLTLLVLLLLGVSLTNGLLTGLSWRGVLLGLLLIFVIRPAAAWVSLMVRRSGTSSRRRTSPADRVMIAFFGVRGVGSVYYLAYAAGHEHIEQLGTLWSTVAFTVVISVLIHGFLATPAMAWLDRRNELASAAA